MAKQQIQPVILAYGEVTGHCHQIEGGHTKANLQVKEDGTRELTISERAALVHEEHTKHVFSPGTADVRTQAQYVMGELQRAAD